MPLLLAQRYYWEWLPLPPRADSACTSQLAVPELLGGSLFALLRMGEPSQRQPLGPLSHSWDLLPMPDRKFERQRRLGGDSEADPPKQSGP